MLVNNLTRKFPQNALWKNPNPINVNLLRSFCDPKNPKETPYVSPKQGLCSLEEKGKKPPSPGDAAGTTGKQGTCQPPVKTQATSTPPPAPSEKPPTGQDKCGKSMKLNLSDLPKSLARIKTLQERFQREDGSPIFLKMGIRDQILYRLTMALALYGLASIVKLFVFDMN